MRKIRIAQIGINRHSHAGEIFDTLKKLPEIFEIVGYAIVEDERETCAKKLDVFEGYREMTVEEILSDETIEAVAVETDEIHLTKYATMVAKAGKHMHMEKPGGTDLRAFEEMIELVKKNGKVFHVGYMYRYNPYISQLIKESKEGKYGTVYTVEAQMNRYDKASTREWLSAFPGGMMFYLGCHLVDLLLQIKGDPIRITPYNGVTGFDGVTAQDAAFAVFEYPEGASFVKVAGTEIGGGNRRQLVVCAERGVVELRPLEKTAPGEKYCHTTGRRTVVLDENGKSKTETDESEVFHRYKDMLRAFAAMVRGEKENPYTVDYELKLYRTMLKACGVDVE
ncbi:MAG: Gfo/Idh/MocA family oxidoreductase [Clostridia bacterium]|nr:Gfo/Idh/MocA family oxidoreductase [Clostridia bacterium]